MSHLTQMVGLTVQNFVSAAVGIAVAVALIRGLTRRRSETIGNFWVDLVRTTTRVLLPLSVVVALLLASQGVVQSVRGPAQAQTVEGADAGDLPRPGREPGGDQGAGYERRRDRQRQLGPPVREPDRLHEPDRAAVAAADPVRAHVRVRPDGRQPAAGLGDLRRDVHALDRLGRGRDLLRGRGEPAHRCGRGEHGGEGGALRRARLRALRRRHHGNVDGRGQRRPRQLHSRRRRGAAREHDARRGLARRRRRGPLRDARLRPALRVHRRADGRTDTRVPREEDPGGGDEARRAVPARHTASGAGVQRDVPRDRAGHVVDPQSRPARPLGGAVRLHVGVEQQRLRLRRPDREHRLVQHDARPGDARAAASC